MQRKLIKVGSSAAVLIPKATLDELKVKIGDTVHIEMSKKALATTPSVVDPKIVQWTEDFIGQYRPLLKRLSKA